MCMGLFGLQEAASRAPYMRGQGLWRAPDAAACCWQHIAHCCAWPAVVALCIRRSGPGVSSKLLVFLQAPAAAAAAPAAAGKETPQERLKRLMQAQLNKAAQKDSLAVAQRKIQVCTGPDRVAAELLLVQDTLLPGDAGRGVLFLGQEGLFCVQGQCCEVAAWPLSWRQCMCLVLLPRMSSRDDADDACPTCRPTGCATCVPACWAAGGRPLITLH